MRVLAGSCTQKSTPFHIFSFFMKTHTGRLSNGAVKIRRTGRSSGFYVACRGEKMPPDGTRKSEGPAEREFLCRRLGRPVLGGCPRAEAKQRAFPKREMPVPVRGRSLRIFYTEAEVCAHT